MVFNSKKLKPGASRGGPGRGSCPDPQRLCGDRTGQGGGRQCQARHCPCGQRLSPPRGWQAWTGSTAVQGASLRKCPHSGEKGLMSRSL